MSTIVRIVAVVRSIDPPQISRHRLHVRVESRIARLIRHRAESCSLDKHVKSYMQTKKIKLRLIQQ